MRSFIAALLVGAGLLVPWLGCGSFGATSPTDPEAGTPEAGEDPGSDASVKADALPPASQRFCADAGAWRRCIDFDSKEQLSEPFGFDRVIYDKIPATLVVDSVDSTSPPNSLAASALNAAASGELEIDLGDEASLTEVRFAAKFRIVTVSEGTSSSAHFLTMRCKDTADRRAYLKMTTPEKLGVRQEDPSGVDPSSEVIGAPGPTWHELAVKWSLVGASPTMTVQVDGNTRFGGDLPLVTFGCAQGLVLRTGMYVSSGAGTYEFRFDDVRVSW